MSAPPPPNDDPWVGRVIEGRYRVLRRIGEGGMGIVYEAEHLKLGKHVALKVILSDRTQDPEVAARFMREARATAQLEHPHIVAGFDYGILPEGGAFMVAQLVRGTSLAERIDQGPTAWREACAIVAQVADALAAIHAAGYVHRDLTPDNVLISARADGSRHAYVLDFGVAASATGAIEGGALTVMGTIVGTQGYMSPEQALARPVDGRSDLYVLGVLLWELIAGKRLFAQRRTLTEIVATQLGTEVAALANPPAPGLPFDLEKLIRDLLQPEPESRPASAEVVRATIARVLEGRSAAPEPSLASSDAVVIAGGAAKVGDALRTREGKIALIVGGTAAALITIVTITIAVIASGGEDETPAIAPTAAPVESPVAPTTPVVPEATSPALDAAIETLMNGRLRREREQVATAILAGEVAPEIPQYLHLAAQLELANTCNERSELLAGIRTLADPRARPVVQRLAESPRSGCGRGRRQDCYACVRDDLDATMTALGGR